MLRVMKLTITNFFCLEKRVGFEGIYFHLMYAGFFRGVINSVYGAAEH
jgi:hypothetical protein